MASVVIVVSLGFKFYAKGLLSAAVLLSIIAGYIVALFIGMVNFGGVGNAAYFAVPMPFHFGLGLQLVPEALQHLGGTWKILAVSGLLPAALLAIIMNLLLPEEI